MSTNKCGFCSTPCSLLCSNCRNVAYCSREHQKSHRKVHKSQCFPITISENSTLGSHLITTRNVIAGEILFSDEPLVIGPRSNLPSFLLLCMGCYNEAKNSCKTCMWPICNTDCEQSFWHSNFECQLFAKHKVSLVNNDNIYLAVSVLRCLLLKQKEPERWKKLMEFESHVEARKSKAEINYQSCQIITFIRETCKLEFQPHIIDFVFGILLVNGYSDAAKYSVKLYALAAKLSHSCVPNTRPSLSQKIKPEEMKIQQKKLYIIASVNINCGESLTQLYGSLLKGTFERQQLIQNIYYFTCKCIRCEDPTEMNIYFSAIKCSKCKSQQDKNSYILPIEPYNLNTQWKCNSCKSLYSYTKDIFPIIQTVYNETDTSEDYSMYSEFEMYSNENPNVPLEENEDVVKMKLEYIKAMIQKIEWLQQTLVHPNHYALLPIKTSLVSTTYSIIPKLRIKKEHIAQLIDIMIKIVKDVLNILEIFLPGVTRERGITLFYLAEMYRLQYEIVKLCSITIEELEALQKEAWKILQIESEDDSIRQLAMTQFIKK